MGSKVISGGQTDRLVYLISPLSFFESRLKIGFWNLRLKKLNICRFLPYLTPTLYLSLLL
jgi:hypothetical protein